MEPMHVEVPPPKEAAGRVTRTALVDGRERVRLSVPEEHAALTTDTADPFVVLLLGDF